MLERIRASGRPLVLFTNGSHITAQAIARGLSEDGLPVADHELLTPIESTLTYLQRHHRDRPVLLLTSEVIRERMAEGGVDAAQEEEAEVVFVAHVDEMEMPTLEQQRARFCAEGRRGSRPPRAAHP